MGSEEQRKHLAGRLRPFAGAGWGFAVVLGMAGRPWMARAACHFPEGQANQTTAPQGMASCGGWSHHRACCVTGGELGRRLWRHPGGLWETSAFVLLPLKAMGGGGGRSGRFRLSLVLTLGLSLLSQPRSSAQWVFLDHAAWSCPPTGQPHQGQCATIGSRWALM